MKDLFLAETLNLKANGLTKLTFKESVSIFGGEKLPPTTPQAPLLVKIFILAGITLGIAGGLALRKVLINREYKNLCKEYHDLATLTIDANAFWKHAYYSEFNAWAESKGLKITLYDVFKSLNNEHDFSLHMENNHGSDSELQLVPFNPNKARNESILQQVHTYITNSYTRFSYGSLGFFVGGYVFAAIGCKLVGQDIAMYTPKKSFWS